MLIRQIFRNSARCVAGILLLAFAVAALCIGVGQQKAALSAEKSVGELYTTVALPVPNLQTHWISGGMTKFQYTSKLLTQEQQDIIDWLLAENNPLVKTVSNTGLASAYIPQLQPDLYTNHDYKYSYVRSDALHPADDGAPYCCAMLEVELEEVSERVKSTVDAYKVGLHLTTGKTAKWAEELKTYYSVVVAGKIKSVVGLQPDLPDPTGYTAKLILMLPNEEALSALQLQIGERYLVYGMDYYDLDWDNSLDRYWNKLSVRSITFTMKDYSALSDCGKQYSVPTIAHLEGKVEDFLASAEGQPWQKALDAIAINNQCFPILGVDNLNYIADFIRQKARISQGRDFTAEELSDGTKVCILSESLAEANGIAVGDTITLRYYEYDYDSPYQTFLLENPMAAGIQSPAAIYYTATTPFVNEGASYTVVGLYRNNGWEDPENNIYSFTPNTVFVPKASVSGTMDYADQGLFRTIVLENGSMAAFRSATEAAGYGNLFTYYDQGYSEVQGQMTNFRDMANKAVITGIVLAGAMFLIYLLLLPMQQKKTLYTMTSLGASPFHKLRHVLSCVLVHMTPGAVIGFALSQLLWQQVSDKLITASEVTVALTLEVESSLMAATAAMVSVLVLLLSAVLSMPWIWNTAPMKRK